MRGRHMGSCCNYGALEERGGPHVACAAGLELQTKLSRLLQHLVSCPP